MEMVSNSRPSTTASKLTTPIGEVSVPDLNAWNNTSFSQLCLRKSDSELTMLSHSRDLSPDKRAIAAQMIEDSTGNQV
jgi:hypothetical protein